MTKALLAAFVLVGSAFFVGCAAEAPTVQTTKSNDRSASDETKPSSSSSSSKSDPTDTPTTTATTDRAAPSEATTPAAAPVAPKDVDVKPIDPAKPVAPVIPAFACKTDEDSVTASYKIALLRAPDQDGLSYWVLQVQGGQSRLEVLRNMVRSDEFTKSRSVLSNEQFVNSLYTGFLARQPDEDGKAFWLNALASGGSRTDVALSFVNSDEFADPNSNKQASCYF
jgi:hypothetical protein